jgi:hypothetical protein
MQKQRITYYSQRRNSKSVYPGQALKFASNGIGCCYQSLANDIMPQFNPARDSKQCTRQV